LSHNGDEISRAINGKPEARIQLSPNQRLALAALRARGGIPAIVSALQVKIPEIADINRPGLTAALEDLRIILPWLVIKEVPTNRNQLTKWAINPDLLRVMRRN
jgi:hypothetical protein